MKYYFSDFPSKLKTAKSGNTAYLLLPVHVNTDKKSPAHLPVMHPSNLSVFSCLLCEQTAQSHSGGELTLGEDTDVTLPWEQASSEQASLPRFVPRSLVAD